MSGLAVGANAAPTAASPQEPLERAIPEGHTRSLARSAVPGAIVGILLGGGGTSAIARSNPGLAAGLSALGVLSLGATVTAINYTNHNGTFHDGKQWNHPIESMAIGGAIGGAASAIGATMIGRPGLIVPLALAGVVSGGVSGAILHYFNRPN
jgi:hypothetical protein